MEKTAKAPKIENDDKESSKFFVSEWMSRNSKLKSVTTLSVLAVLLGVANVVLFSPQVVGNIARNISSCGGNFRGNPTGAQLSLWAAAGIFTILAFVVAVLDKSSDDAWSSKTTAFAVLAPLAILVSAGATAAAALMGACVLEERLPLITPSFSIDSLSQWPILYSIIDFLVMLFSFIIFILLLIVWINTLIKRSKSKKRTKKVEAANSVPAKEPSPLVSPISSTLTTPTITTTTTAATSFPNNQTSTTTTLSPMTTLPSTTTYSATAPISMSTLPPSTAYSTSPKVYIYQPPPNQSYVPNYSTLPQPPMTNYYPRPIQPPPNYFQPTGPPFFSRPLPRLPFRSTTPRYPMYRRQY